MHQPNPAAHTTTAPEPRLAEQALAILAAFPSARGLSAKASTLLDHLARDLGVECGWILVREGGQLVVAATSSDDRLSKRLSTSGPLGTMLESSSRPVSRSSSIELAQFGAARAYPIHDDEGQLIGALLLQFDANTAMELDRLVELLSPHLRAMVDEHGERARELAQPAVSEQDLLDIAEMLSLRHTIRDLCECILREALVRSGADTATLWAYDHTNDSLRVRAVRGLPNPHLERLINSGRSPGARVRRGQGLAGEVLADGETRIVRYGDGPSRRRERGSVMCAPLFHRDRVVAVLMLKSHGPDSGLPASARSIQRLAGVAGPAFARAVVQDQASVDTDSGLQSAELTRAMLDMELAHATAVNEELTIILCHIEGYNLIEVAESWTSSLRERDFAGSLSPGCLLVVLPNTPAVGARVVAERLAHTPEVPAQGTQQHVIVAARPGDTKNSMLQRAADLAERMSPTAGILIHSVQDTPEH